MKKYKINKYYNSGNKKIRYVVQRKIPFKFNSIISWFKTDWEYVDAFDSRAEAQLLIDWLKWENV